MSLQLDCIDYMCWLIVLLKIISILMRKKRNATSEFKYWFLVIKAQVIGRNGNAEEDNWWVLVITGILFELSVHLPNGCELISCVQEDNCKCLQSSWTGPSIHSWFCGRIIFCHSHCKFMIYSPFRFYLNFYNYNY